MESIQIQVESPSKIQRKLKIRVPASIVTERMERTLQKVQKDAKVKGFRPGHVPPNVVRQMYAEEIRSQVLQDLIDDSVRQGVRENQIRAVSRPIIGTGEACDHDHGHDHDHDHDDHGHHHHHHNHYPKIIEGMDLTFDATLEILPEVDVKSYTGHSLSRPSAELSDADLNAFFDRVRDNHAELVPVEDSEKYKAVKGDFVDLAYHGKLVTPEGLIERDGMQGTKVTQIGSGDLIPGFEDNLIGMKAGESTTFRIHFPEDYAEKDLSKQEAEFSVTVNSIKKKKLPELNDDLAKQLGFGGLTEYKEKVKDQLTKNKKQESDNGLRNQLLQTLIEKNPFDIPPTLLLTRTRELAQELGEELKSQRYPVDLIQKFIGSEVENLKKRAENQIRAGILLDTISKKESIQADDAELKAEMERMAKEMNVELSKVEEYYAQNPEAKENVLFRLTEEKTVEFLYSKSKIKNA